MANFNAIIMNCYRQFMEIMSILMMDYFLVHIDDSVMLYSLDDIV